MSPKRLERCLAKVSKKKGIKSAYGICVASTGIKKKKGGGWAKGKKTKIRKGGKW